MLFILFRTPSRKGRCTGREETERQRTNRERRSRRRPLGLHSAEEGRPKCRDSCYSSAWPRHSSFCCWYASARRAQMHGPSSALLLLVNVSISHPLSDADLF